MHTPERDLPKNLSDLIETLAEHSYSIRARQRAAGRESLKPGPPKGFPPYHELSDIEKQDYRNAVIEGLKLILNLGYKLEPPKIQRAEGEGQDALASLTATLGLIDAVNLPGAIALWQSHDPEEWAHTPELFRRLGRRVLKLGEPLLAYDVLTEGLKANRADVVLRQLVALALARSGATERSNAILTQLRAEGHRDEETLGILARTHKDLWARATTKTERARQLKLAHKFYYEAYKLNRGYYSGINAATLALLLEKKNDARGLAQKVREACLAELKALPKQSEYRYWPLATLGEACLILRRWSEAEDWYLQAAQAGIGNYAELSSTRRNARLLLTHLRRDSAPIEQALRIPGIVVFTGHLMDRSDRASPRFPAQLEPVVRNAVQNYLKKINPGFGYSSAGCGADILFLETLQSRGNETHVVLPYGKQQFIEDSVAFAGKEWVKRFESVLGRATTVTTASSERIEEGSMSFEYANLLLYGVADIRARQLETDLVPLAVWDRRPGDGPGGTASAVEHWKDLGLNVQVIDMAKMLKHELSRTHAKGRKSDSLSPWERAGVRVRSLAGKNPKEKNTSTLAVSPHPGPLPRGEGTKHSESLPTRIMAMLFADAVNFSKLTEQQIPLFLNHFLGAIGQLISTSAHAPSIKNTWGDGLYFVFAEVLDAGLFALELCDLMVSTDWGKKGLPKALNLRIALHAGPVYECVDPVTGQHSYTGTHVSRAARIEPITPPGQVYASQGFAALAAAQGVQQFTCDYVGQTPLAKGYGTFATYHVRGRQTSR